MKYLQADASAVKAHIAKLLNDYPELQDDETFRVDVIEGETDMHKIIERCLSQRQDALTMADAIKIRETDLAERRKRFERKSDAMKAIIQDMMEAAHIDKLPLPEATLSITKPRESVNVTDLDALPQGYFKMTRSADKAAIKAALMSGDEIPGAELQTGNPGMTIRSK